MTNPIQKINSGVATNVSELVFTNFTTDYIRYVLEFNGLVSNTLDTTNLVARLSIDNGATWVSTDTSYKNLVQKAAGAGGSITRNIGTWNWSYMVQGISNTSGLFTAGTLEIYNPMDSGSRTKILCRSGGKLGNSLGSAVQLDEMVRQASEANNALRLFSESESLAPGNFSMTWALYGCLA